MTQHGAALIAAVRADDKAGIWDLLGAGADPDAPGEDGLSALDIAVGEGLAAAFEALRQYAKLDRRSSDGFTPLLRAVDAGCYAIADLLTGSSAATGLTGPDGRTALELARHWHETGAENELRRRTGATGPAELSRVPDDEDGFWLTGLLRLGGAQVRTGHTAILCSLEVAYGIRTPFEELLARAEAEPDLEHVTHSATVKVLYQRADRDTWEAAAALRTHPRPSARRFGADVLRCMALFDECGGDEGCVEAPGCPVPPSRELFLGWLTEETDPEVLAEVISGLAETDPPDFLDLALPHHGHPSAVVRRAVVVTLYGQPDDAAVGDRLRPVLLAYLRDSDASIRGRACETLAERKERSAEVRDAVARLLDDPEEFVRVEAMRTLTLLDDPRGEEALERFPHPYDEDAPYFGRLYDAHRHLGQRRAAARAAD
ncbi:HEAT repeat domain-containing protein [Streptomyces sp. APSN-46.1]|uniref:HEAT repeat domain-containing protein n=1 Tax=Streptomyces sp. APSN-46.1 TaxID=2929049 RepID=UPI001FB33A25|nr:HEAT repeat domain-containing protein [Streptomyces sp. APSN-46.1]MCJ1679681.1 HEAT repeat domain-containing protein [Streptomyces sp. APSN-46.1]